MRTNILKITLIVLTVGLFGYVGYKDVIFDAAQPVETQLASVAPEIKKAAEVRKLTSQELGIRRAEIAVAEYRKGVVEATPNCNCGPEIDKYTQGHPAQWCAMFVSWVANEAGSPLWSDKTKSWRITNSRDMATYLEQNGTWHSREEVLAKGLKPQVGDLVVFWRGNFEDHLGHVDVVAAVGDTPGTADLIGGNIQSRVKYRDNFPYMQNYGFLGFGHPEK